MNRTTLLASSLLLLLSTGCGPSLPTLHQRAQTGAVQADAPLHARHALVVDAPIDQVWARLSDMAAWPSWHPSVRSVHAPAVLAPGASFTWTNEGSDITSQLALVRPRETLAWTGSVATAKAVHVWHLSEPAPGQTRVEVDETMDGLLLTWFYGQKDLDQAVVTWLNDLKVACEKTL